MMQNKMKIRVCYSSYRETIHSHFNLQHLLQVHLRLMAAIERNGKEETSAQWSSFSRTVEQLFSGSAVGCWYNKLWLQSLSWLLNFDKIY